MADLSAQLLEPSVRPVVVADACALIDSEVRRTSGVSGLALRSAYKVVRGVRPGIVPKVVDELLPAFTASLDDLHRTSRETGRPLGEVVGDDPAAVADVLLSVADDRVARSSRTAVRSAYQRVRGTAHKHVVAALPAAAALVEKHAPTGTSAP